jgi:GPH family glycoside/pentoside/hexuronide:cation symporter
MLKKIGYSAGDFGISISYFVVGFFFMYYLTDIVGISPLLAGTVILIGKVWEAISNPLVGILNDRTKSRFGKKRVFIFLGAIPFAISFMLLWLIPNSFNESVRFIMALAAFLLYSTAYSVVSVPYMALVPIMTRDYDERTQITGIRAIFSTVGIILGGASALLISSFTDETLGLRTMAIGFGIFTALSLLIAARSVKGVEENDKKSQDTVPARFKQYITIARSRHFLILLIFKFLGAIATGCLMASIPYFARHILVDVGSSTYGLAIYTITSALLIPVWYKLTNRFDKRRLLLIANSLGAIILLAMGIFINDSSAYLFFIGCGLLGIIMSSYLLIPYSLVPDVVDFYRHETGERHESVYFGLWMTVHQLGIAVAGFILGAFLNLLGYAGNAEVQTGSALVAVRLAFGLIPGLFLVFAAIVLQKYGITRAIYQKIQAELKRSPEKTSN